MIPFSDNCKFIVSNNQFEQESITLDSDIKTFVEKIAEHKNTDKNKIVNMLIRNNKHYLNNYHRFMRNFNIKSISSWINEKTNNYEKVLLYIF